MKAADELEFLELVKMIRNLPQPQRNALDRICIGDDSAIHPETGKALARRGLVEIRTVELRGGMPVFVRRYDVASFRVHMAWCEA